MSAFPVAAAPTARKLRGGYYTPPEIAEFVAGWACKSGARVLEPSCGNGAILRFVPEDAEATGIEFFAAEAAAARKAAPAADVVTADFFEWVSSSEAESWDAVVGNPPFIRFQHWTEPTRTRAFDLMRSVSMSPTKLTNAWVPFVVASTLMLRPGGRLAMVLPAELLQVTYASELRAFLIDNYKSLTVVAFRRLVFDGILQEVVVLLGTKGRGPATVRVAERDSSADLPSPTRLRRLPGAPALLHESEKWTKYFLPPEEIDVLRTLRNGSDALGRLGTLADVDVGVVTGRNQFFVLKPSRAAERRLESHVVPLVSKSAHVRGVRFKPSDLAKLTKDDTHCRLLAVQPSARVSEDDPLWDYLAEGEDADVHRGYKCSIRKDWWSVPSVWIPDAFMLRQIYDHPRIIANATRATSTDTVHRVRMLNGTSAATLAAASINSATFAFSEVMGRSYGGGVLELEPREAEALPLPNPRGLDGGDVETVDRLLRDGALEEALDYVDERLLMRDAGLDGDFVARLRSSWRRLRDRRLARGKGATT
ncbi:MAG: N-6 DNA methylase [Chloroflexota bacterium]